MSNQVDVGIEQDGRGNWRVAIKKGAGVIYPQRHPVLLSTEADAVARELTNAANECRRRNAPPLRKWP